MIAITQPRGIVPKSNGCALPPNYASRAQNMDFSREGWVPWRQPTKLLEFENPIGTAHVANCCWSGVPVKKAEYLNAGACGNKTYLSAENEHAAFAEDFCSDQWERLGFPIPERPDITVIHDDEPCGPDSQKITYKLVYCSECEQGPGSYPSESVEVDAKASIAITLPPPPDPCWGITHIKIYREAATWDIERGFVSFDGDINPGWADLSTESDYFLAATVPIGTREYCDERTDCLGHHLVTDDFFPPVKGLQITGETSLGSLVGFEGRHVWFSERNAYWAYPLRTRHNFPDEVRCVGVCQDTVIVVTQCRVYLISDQVDCKDSSCRPVVELKEQFQYCGCDCQVIPNGILFPTTEGLALVTREGQFSMASSQAFDKEAWRCADPACLRFAVYCDHLFMSNGQRSYVWLLQFSENLQLPEYVGTLSFVPDQWINDGKERLYFTSENCVYSFNTGAEYMDMDWEQAEQRSPAKQRFSSVHAEYREKKREKANTLTLYKDDKVAVVTKAANRAARFRSTRTACTAIRVQGNEPMCGLYYGVGRLNLTQQETRG